MIRQFNTSSSKKDWFTGAYLGLLQSFQASYFLKYLWTTTFDDSTCHLDYLNHWVTVPILELVGMGVLFQWRAVILSEEEKCGTFLFPFLLVSIHRCIENPVEHLQWSFFAKIVNGKFINIKVKAYIFFLSTSKLFASFSASFRLFFSSWRAFFKSPSFCFFRSSFSSARKTGKYW